MRKLSLPLLLVVAGLFLVGCGTQSGDTLVKYERNGMARMSEAPADGTYALYGSHDTTPLVKYPLNKGDKIGFEQRADGTYAVAGDHADLIKTSWATGTFYWKQNK